MNPNMKFYSSRDLANIIGVAVQTLAKWRRTGRGPTGWLRISQNLVVYPEASVRKWLEEQGKETSFTDHDWDTGTDPA